MIKTMGRLFILTLLRLGIKVTEIGGNTIRIDEPENYLKAKALTLQFFSSKEVGFSIPDPNNWYIKNGHHDNAMYIYL